MGVFLAWRKMAANQTNETTVDTDAKAGCGRVLGGRNKRRVEAQLSYFAFLRAIPRGGLAALHYILLDERIARLSTAM